MRYLLCPSFAASQSLTPSALKIQHGHQSPQRARTEVVIAVPSRWSSLRAASKSASSSLPVQSQPNAKPQVPSQSDTLASPQRQNWWSSTGCLCDCPLHKTSWRPHCPDVFTRPSSNQRAEAENGRDLLWRGLDWRQARLPPPKCSPCLWCNRNVTAQHLHNVSS